MGEKCFPGGENWLSVFYLNSFNLRRMAYFFLESVNLLKPICHVIYQQFNIQELYVLPTLYLCVLYLAENRQRLVPLTE